MSVLNLNKYFIEGAAKAFSYAIAPLNAFSLQTNLNGCLQNSYITVPNVRLATTASSNFTHAAGYSGDNSDILGVQVQLTGWKYQPFVWTDTIASTSTPDSLREQGASIANRLAYDVVSDILNSTGSFSNYTQASGSAYATVTPVTALGEDADDAYWPVDGRTLIVSPALFWKMASNTTTMVASAYGGNDVIRSGLIEDYYGFKVRRTHCLPSTIKGLAATNRALAVGISIPTPQTGHTLDYVEQLGSEETGLLPIQYVRYYDNAKRQMVNVIECIYGKSVLDASAAINLVVTNVAV